MYSHVFTCYEQELNHQSTSSFKVVLLNNGY